LKFEGLKDTISPFGFRSNKKSSLFIITAADHNCGIIMAGKIRVVGKH